MLIANCYLFMEPTKSYKQIQQKKKKKINRTLRTNRFSKSKTKKKKKAEFNYVWRLHGHISGFFNTQKALL